MTIIRTVMAKVRPGQAQNAVSQLATFNRVFLETGATHFTAYHMHTGPIFPGIMIHIVYDDMAAYGAGRQQFMQHPDGGAAAFAADAPLETVRALLEEPVHLVGGDDDGNWLAQTKVRFTLTLRPSKGRAADVVKNASQLADTAHQCGAIAASVRRVIAGSDGPLIVLASYHPGFAEFEEARQAVLQSEVWAGLISSQDDTALRQTSLLSEKIAL